MNTHIEIYTHAYIFMHIDEYFQPGIFRECDEHIQAQLSSMALSRLQSTVVILKLHVAKRPWVSVKM